MTIDTNNPITQYAATVDPMFAFSAKQGGAIEVVGGSAKAASAASQIIGSLGSVGSITRETALSTVVAGAASLAALGDINPLAIGVGAMAGVISSVSKGRGSKV